MTKLCVVGGKLQGMEATYLAKKAGYDVILIDRRHKPIASALADEFHKLDVIKDREAIKAIFKRTDAVLPALEDVKALLITEKMCQEVGVPYMQDNASFILTSNKYNFIRFCEKHGLPFPEMFPEAELPFIIKPVVSSGSRGIHLVNTFKELEKVWRRMKKRGIKFLVQEYVTGYFLSLELFGLNGCPLPMQVTCLEFDESYGCKRVLAPWPYESKIINDVVTLGKKLVKKMNLTGLTDVQVVVHDGIVKIIEANARLPSQTPTVVYHSTGINMVKSLVEMFTKNKLPNHQPNIEKAVIYEHILIKDGKLKVVAEHNLSNAMGMRIEKGFYGTDEALTNLSHEGGVATLIVSGANLQQAKMKMEEVIKLIAQDYKVTIEDKSPSGFRNVYDEINTS